MESIDKIWDYLSKLPEMLNQYGRYSYALLFVLLIGGLLIGGFHLFRRSRKKPGLSGPVVAFAFALAFLSSGGFFLRWVGSQEQEKSRNALIASLRAPAGEHWLLVFDFSLPPDLDDPARNRLLQRMELLVGGMSEVLLEDLPSDFPQPRVMRIPVDRNPWAEGIDQGNFEQVIRELNAFEIMWGDIHEQGTRAKAFLGLSPQVARDLDRIIPLRDVLLDQDLNRDQRFGDGYYRLLGLVTLGMGLDTFRRGEAAAANERQQLFVLAAAQLAKAQQLVVNKRDDAMLQRTVYSPKVDTLIGIAIRESEKTQ